MSKRNSEGDITETDATEEQGTGSKKFKNNLVLESHAHDEVEGGLEQHNNLEGGHEDSTPEAGAGGVKEELDSDEQGHNSSSSEDTKEEENIYSIAKRLQEKLKVYAIVYARKLRTGEKDIENLDPFEKEVVKFALEIFAEEIEQDRLEELRNQEKIPT